MKSFVIILAYLLVACMWLEAEGDCTPYSSASGSPANVETGTVVVADCAQHTCQDDGTWSYSGCAIPSCASPSIAKEYDFSKPFPACCPTCVKLDDV